MQIYILYIYYVYTDIQSKIQIIHQNHIYLQYVSVYVIGKVL